MKAWTHRGWTTPDDLVLRDVDEPEIGEHDVLIRVKAAASNPYDWHLLRGWPVVARPMMTRVRGPRDAVATPGADVSGVVERVGPAVTRFSIGDAVFGDIARGAFAELAAARDDLLALKPESLSFEEAAAVPMAAMTALQGLRDAGALRIGQRVLVNGAGGGIGTFAVQIAHALGAAEITGVCSAGKADTVLGLGADEVIDYAREDFTRRGRRHDLVLDAVGVRGASAMRRALDPRGTLVLAGGGSGRIVGPIGVIARAMLQRPFTRQRIVSHVSRPNASDLEYLAGLAEDGRLRAVIGRTVPFADAPDAIHHVETGHALGKTVVAMTT
jgi:NADPH:quinone reductase-like Zn-dependent oxidoreductase